ncbi:hypothetical protein DF185_14815 [Marinifilum breve]|uniref:DUF4920 domain-containing protein n=1 Tax=Marinifilum breve TaxID=2184082 RepID=A0A2V3ZVR4_9BACT|nr:hypothetical protein [Marinifilum breve]PXX99146.1 hypothetical protein DF185_14815 [Marinifilum breve]
MKYLSLLAMCIMMLSCNSVQKEKTENKEVAQIKQAALSIEQVMQTAADNVGKEVYFQGTVNHVCAHSGKRCILKTADGKLSIRVEATGKLEGFTKELAGNDLIVTGTLREKRLEPSYIDKLEADIKAKQFDEEEGEHCSSEMANIKEMRDWMKENNKDYYAIYYVDGTAYEIVE